MNAAPRFSRTGGFLAGIQRLYEYRKMLLKAVNVFQLFGIPHFVYVGLAVQEHGYPRFTVNVDIIVPDVALAREKLALNGFVETPALL